MEEVAVVKCKLLDSEKIKTAITSAQYTLIDALEIYFYKTFGHVNEKYQDVILSAYYYFYKAGDTKRLEDIENILQHTFEIEKSVEVFSRHGFPWQYNSTSFGQSLNVSSDQQRESVENRIIGDVPFPLALGERENLMDSHSEQNKNNKVVSRCSIASQKSDLTFSELNRVSIPTRTWTSFGISKEKLPCTHEMLERVDALDEILACWNGNSESSHNVNTNMHISDSNMKKSEITQDSIYYEIVKLFEKLESLEHRTPLISGLSNTDISTKSSFSNELCSKIQSATSTISDSRDNKISERSKIKISIQDIHERLKIVEDKWITNLTQSSNTHTASSQDLDAPNSNYVGNPTVDGVIYLLQSQKIKTALGIKNEDGLILRFNQAFRHIERENRNKILCAFLSLFRRNKNTQELEETLGEFLLMEESLNKIEMQSKKNPKIIQRCEKIDLPILKKSQQKMEISSCITDFLRVSEQKEKKSLKCIENFDIFTPRVSTVDVLSRNKISVLVSEKSSNTPTKAAIPTTTKISDQTAKTMRIGNRHQQNSYKIQCASFFTPDTDSDRNNDKENFSESSSSSDSSSESNKHQNSSITRRSNKEISISIQDGLSCKSNLNLLHIIILYCYLFV